jgi:hypothetical protein
MRRVIFRDAAMSFKTLQKRLQIFSTSAAV